MRDIKAYFDERAATWDQATDYNTDHIRAMLMLCDIKPGSTILDVGCGTGILEPYLMRYKPKRILAVDFAEGMIAAARRKLTDKRVTFRCDDIFYVSPVDIRCDQCFLYAVFPYFDEPRRLLRHLCTLMEPGARLTISHPQGSRVEGGTGGAFSQRLPAERVTGLLTPFFRLDTVIDSNVMFMVSGTLLDKRGE